MVLPKSRASRNASEYARQNAKNEGFSSYSVRTRAFFGASFFALLYILLLNIFTYESDNHAIPYLRLNHRTIRSLGQRIMLTTCGPQVRQHAPNQGCQKKNNKPLPGETVEDYLERSCRRVELTDEMKDRLKSCHPHITEEDMFKWYSTLYNDHVSIFKDLIERLNVATHMLAANCKQDKCFQNKCRSHLYKKLGKELIKLSDKDDDGGFKRFLKESKICSTSDFTKFLEDSMNAWNDFIKEHEEVAYAELKEALQSGTLKKTKGKN